MPTKTQLIGQLAVLGLSRGGRRPTLSSAWLTPRSQRRPASVTSPDTVCFDAIVAAPVEAGEPEMVGVSKARLKSVVDTDEIYVENVREKQFVGNERGLKYAYAGAFMDQFESRLRSIEQDHQGLKADHRGLKADHRGLKADHQGLKADHQELKAKMEKLTAKVDTQQVTIDNHQLTIDNHQVTIDDFVEIARHIRHRFIAIYKRDKLGDTTAENNAIIRRGNRLAYNGLCKVDARLCGQPGGQDNVPAYRSLYGLDPEVVCSISESLSYF
jgi:hypothetical protein